MAETTALDENGELVVAASGRRVVRRWPGVEENSPGGETMICGPQLQRILAIMKQNGGVRRYGQGEDLQSITEEPLGGMDGND